MGRTIQVAADRAQDETKTVLPAEVARGIYVENPPSALALKLMHVMIASAGGRLADEVQHSIRLSEIRAVAGMKHHDRKSLALLFTELRGAVLIYDDRVRTRVTIGGFLDEAVIDYQEEPRGNLLVAWWFGRTFRRMAEESNHWAILDRQTVFALGSKYSILLFQHIASLTGLAHVRAKTFSVLELRALFGIPAGKIKRFANLKNDVLDPAVAEINQVSRLTLTATPRKVGRTVVSVEIAWTEKPDPREAKAEARRHSAGRVARREGTVERIASETPGAAAPEPPAVFPETGGITYSPRWLDLKRAAGCDRDNLLVGSDFRAFLKKRGIRRDAANIEQVFSDWCRVVGEA